MLPISLSKAMISKWQNVCVCVCVVTKQIPSLSYFHERSGVCIVMLWMYICNLPPPSSLQCAKHLFIQLLLLYVTHLSTKYAENADHAGSLKLERHLSFSFYQRFYLLFLDMRPPHGPSVVILKEEEPLSNASLSCIILCNLLMNLYSAFLFMPHAFMLSQIHPCTFFFSSSSNVGLFMETLGLTLCSHPTYLLP